MFNKGRIRELEQQIEDMKKLPQHHYEMVTDPQEIIRLGNNAKLLLDVETFSYAWEELMNDTIKMIKNSEPPERELRELLYHRIGALKDVAYKLDGYISNAEMQVVTNKNG